MRVAATVDMGEPILDGRAIPVNADGRVIAWPLEVAGRPYQITAVSMGNPHCVIFVDDESIFALDDVAFAQLGTKFEHHPLFPKRVNTEFILPLSRERLKMRVWERGSGETLACGTGACAALVAAVLNGHSERKATVELRRRQARNRMARAWRWRQSRFHDRRGGRSLSRHDRGW